MVAARPSRAGGRFAAAPGRQSAPPRHRTGPRRQAAQPGTHLVGLKVAGWSGKASRIWRISSERPNVARPSPRCRCGRPDGWAITATATTPCLRRRAVSAKRLGDPVQPTGQLGTQLGVPRCSCSARSRRASWRGGWPSRRGGGTVAFEAGQLTTELLLGVGDQLLGLLRQVRDRVRTGPSRPGHALDLPADAVGAHGQRTPIRLQSRPQHPVGDRASALLGGMDGPFRHATGRRGRPGSAGRCGSAAAVEVRRCW